MCVEYTPRKASLSLGLLLSSVMMVCKNLHPRIKTGRPTLCSGLFVLFFTCPRVISSATDPGVGFNLALDYGTASVWYANGTAVEISRVEGGPAYKQTMRFASVQPDLAMPSSGLGQEKLGMMSILDYLPIWGAAKPVDRNADAITWMIIGLKAATEAYIESPLVAVRIVSPFPIFRGSPLESSVKTIIESLGLKYLGTRMASTAITSIYGLEGECESDIFKTPDQFTRPDDPERIYLAVDYSRKGIFAYLVSEECGITQILRKFSNTTIGAAADFPEKHNNLRRLLKDLTRQPFDESHCMHSPEISELVLLGESVENATLHKVLQEVLGEKYTALKAGSEKREEICHPLFAGSRAAAIQCQEEQEYQSTRVWDQDLRGWIDKDL